MGLKVHPWPWRIGLAVGLASLLVACPPPYNPGSVPKGAYKGTLEHLCEEPSRALGVTASGEAAALADIRRASGEYQGTVLRFWPLEGGPPRELKLEFGPPSTYAEVALSRDGTTVAVLERPNNEPKSALVRRFSAKGGAETRVVVPSANYSTVVWSADLSRVAFVNLTSNPASYDVEVWSLPPAGGTATLVASLPVTGSSVAFALSPDGRYLAAGEETMPRQRVSIWRVEPLQKLHTAEASAYGWYAFSPDGQRLALSEGYWQARVLETESGRLLAQLASDRGGGGDPELGRPGPLAFSPDGLELAVRAYFSPDPLVRVYNLVSGASRDLLLASQGRGRYGSHVLVYSGIGALVADTGCGLVAWRPNETVGRRFSIDSDERLSFNLDLTATPSDEQARGYAITGTMTISDPSAGPGLAPLTVSGEGGQLYEPLGKVRSQRSPPSPYRSRLTATDPATGTARWRVNLTAVGGTGRHVGEAVRPSEPDRVFKVELTR